MLTKIYGSAIHGVSAQTITIEVNVDTGVGYYLVGLPDNAIKESSFSFEFSAIIKCLCRFSHDQSTISIFLFTNSR